MGYNRSNYTRIRREYEGKNHKAREEAFKMAQELHAKYPEIERIDETLNSVGFKLFDSALLGKEGYEERAAKIKGEYRELRVARDEYLRSVGLPPDYTDVKYKCAKCSDTGYVGIDMCDCMKLALVEAGYESAGIGQMIGTLTFENFKLHYYDSADNDVMRKNFEHCVRFAEGFNSRDVSAYENLMMMGATGLGKTHLSAAIAKRVIERGFDIVFETAFNIFEDFAYERFRPFGDTEEKRTDRYYNCDLLIMDDIGAESVTPYTVSGFYNIINTRLNNKKPMIINTNYTRDELRTKYTDRITSRLAGNFTFCEFKGKDIRLIKLTET
jgi:DNA replication protein DnaC